MDPSAVWTDWGAMHVSGYKDFKIGEWVEFHGRNGYSLGRVLSVADVWFSKAYIVDVVVSHGDSGGPFIGLEDRIFGGMNSAARDGSIDVGVAFWVRMVGRAAELGRVRTVIYVNMITVEPQTARSTPVRDSVFHVRIS